MAQRDWAWGVSRVEVYPRATRGHSTEVVRAYGRGGQVMTKLVCTVFVLLLATSVLAGHAQEPSAPGAADTPPFDTRQIYDTTMRSDGQRAPVSLDPAALQL